MAVTQEAIGQMYYISLQEVLGNDPYQGDILVFHPPIHHLSSGN